MKKSKKLVTLSLVLTAPLLAITSFVMDGAKVEVLAEEALVSGDIITNNQSNWNDSTNATFTENSMKALNSSFNWQTTKINGNSKVDFLVDQSLELSPQSDWKWEYLSFSVNEEKGIDAGTGITQTKSSVSLVWGWTKGFAIIEQDENGNVIFDKSLGFDETNNIVPENFPKDENIMNQFHIYCYDKSFRIITQMSETSEGVKFDFELITTSPWGHEIDATFSYTSSNTNLKGEKYVTYGRTGSGTIDDTHNVVMTMGIVDPTIYSASKDNWTLCDNATFTGNIMKATNTEFNYQTKEIGGNSKVDFTSNQTLELSAWEDWKFEYLTFSSSTEYGIDAANGMVEAANSVSLVWGWTKGFAVIEKDSAKNVIFDKQLTLDDTGVKITGIPGNDSEILRQFHYYCYDKSFRVITQMSETSDGVKFDFELITKSPWGHEIDATFSYTSTNSQLKGNTKHVTYGRKGSGTIDDTHNIEVTMKVDNIEAIETPDVPTTKYECKLENGTKFEQIEANEGYAYSFASSLNLVENQEFSVDLFIDEDKTSLGYANVVSFVDNSTNESKYQGTFYELGTDGKIKIDVNGNYKIVVNVKENNEAEIDLEVVSYELIDVANRYHSDAANWSTLYNATINDGIMSQTGIPSLSVSKEFKGNATVKFVLDYTSLKSEWGGVALMVKGQVNEFSKVNWTFDSTSNTLKPTVTNQSFIALCITHGGYQLIACDEGNINIIGTDKTFLIPGVDGFSFWNICQQKTEVTFDIEDVLEGVKLNISYRATGHSSNTGVKYNGEVLVPFKSLWGNQVAGIVHVAGQKTPDNTNNQIKLYVLDSESNYSKDYYHANKFEEELAKITYDSITAENYSDIVEKFNNVSKIYNSLTDTQKALVSVENTNRFNQIKDDLENVDVLVLAKLALEKLNTIDEAYNRDNYEDQARIVKDALAKYELLNEQQKAQCDATLVEKLAKCQKDLENYEDILAYADPVVALIAKINLPITNYAKDSRIILAAKKAYDELYDIEKNEVTNVNLLEDALVALKEYEDANKIDGYNFAVSKNNIYELEGFEEIIDDNNVLMVNSSTNDLSIYPTISVANEKEITWVIDSNLQKCTWGNFYFIFRSSSIAKHHNKGNWLQEGNYTILLVGGDGFKIVECVNGIIPMTKDASGNPIADFTTILDYPTDEEGSQYDIHHIYKNYTKIVIKTVDLYENDEYIGYKAIISLTGGESGKTFVREYTSTNKSSKDCGYFGLEAFVSDPINQGSGGFEIKGIYVEDVNEYDGIQVKEDLKNKKVAEECDKLLEQVIIDVTKENLESAKSAYEVAKAAYDALTDAQKALLTKDATILDTAKAAIDKVIKEIEDKPSDLPSEIPSEIPSETPSEEPSEVPSTPSTSDDKTSETKPSEDKPTKKGCKGGATGFVGAMALLGIVFLKKRKN